MSGATKLCYKSGFENFENFQNFQNFQFLYISVFKIFTLINQNFQKTGQYVRGQWLMNMCTKFQVDIFKNGWDMT